MKKGFLPKKYSLPEDDIAVRKEGILELFDPPPKPTAFHDWVNKGRIIKARDLTGYYLLNATRLRQGMPPVDVKKYRWQRTLEPQLKRDAFSHNYAL